MYRLPRENDKQIAKSHSPAKDSGGSLLDQFDEFETVGMQEKPAGRNPHPQPRPQAQAHRDATPIPQAPFEDDAPRASYNGEHSAPFSLDRIYDVGLVDVFHWLRRGLIWIILSVILCCALALTFAAMTPPRFTTYTDVVINPSNLNVVQDAVVPSSQQRDTLVLEVESKLRTMTSRNVLEKVVAELKLDQDPEFITSPPLTRLREIFKPVVPGNNQIGALRSLSDRVSAVRDARSFVVTLAVWSNDGAKSVRISEAVMRAFESELSETDAEGSRRAAADLTKRLDELRQNVTDAEKAVEAYRSEHDLQQINGQLVSDQASGELNAQALAAQQRLIQEQSRLAQMEAAIRQNRISTAAIFDSQTMTKIREQYSMLQQQIGAMTLTYGSRHPRLASAGAERQMLEQSMTDEARRILEMSRSQVAEAEAAKKATDQRANSEQARAFNDNAVMVTLRDLERNARSVAAIYETYLTRARQITEQQAIDSTNIRIISQPVPPNNRNWPPGKLTFLIIGTVVGTMLGVALAMAFGFIGFMRQPTGR